MDLAILTDYINVIILGICLCVGYIIKNIVPTDKFNKYIPLIVGVLGMILAIINNINNVILESVLMGLLSGLASTGLYETFKNLFMKEGK
nr:MAG TPA: holin [Caudoviricetes sp.]